MLTSSLLIFSDFHFHLLSLDFYFSFPCFYPLPYPISFQNDNTDPRRNHQLDLVPLVSDPSWRFDQDNLWRLPGGHGEEIVRSVYVDEKVCMRIHPLFIQSAHT